MSRSLQACEGAILVIDASQGIEAQTLANVHLALAQDLVIIPVINKIDLPSADPEMVMAELEDALAIPREEVLLASAKDGTGVREILEAVVARVPAPIGDARAPLQALVFDSHYDQYKGVVAYVRLASGTLHDHDRIRFMASGAESEILELGYFRPQPVPAPRLAAGEVGYVASGLKSVREAQVGDTLTSVERPADAPLSGYKEPLPLVFAGIYPLRGDDYPELRDALDKLHLNDAGFVYEPESSAALGFGFRCGFLGLLHMEITQERLEREFDLDLIASAPSVEYRVKLLHRADELVVDNPAQMPGVGEIERISEPWVEAQVITPTDYIGPLMELATTRRGEFRTMEYLDPTRVNLHFEMPLGELIIDFYDQLKSRSSGVRQPGLPVHRLPAGRSRQARRARQRGAGGRAEPDRASVERVSVRQGARQQAQGPDPAADVRSAGPGRHRLAYHQPRDDPGHAQERAGQVLRRRRHAQAQAAREAEGREAADEADRVGRDSAGGLPRRAAHERGRPVVRAVRSIYVYTPAPAAPMSRDR